MAGPSGPPLLKWDKNKESKFASAGPKYLIMERTNKEQNLTNVSPFLIKKAIDQAAPNLEECRKLKNGTILIKIKNVKEAQKLTILTSLGNNIDISITTHKTLNLSKGVIYCNDLRGIDEEEI